MVVHAGKGEESGAKAKGKGKGSWGKGKGKSAVGKPTAGLLREWQNPSQWQGGWGNYKGAPQRDDLIFYHWIRVSREFAEAFRDGIDKEDSPYVVLKR